DLADVRRPRRVRPRGGQRERSERPLGDRGPPLPEDCLHVPARPAERSEERTARLHHLDALSRRPLGTTTRAASANAASTASASSAAGIAPCRTSPALRSAIP